MRAGGRVFMFVALLPCLAGTLAFDGRSAASSPPVPGRRVAIFGIDAADWAVIDPLIARGTLPTFARLRRAGDTGILKADPPLLSPLIWTTIATGKRPEDHGVLDFLVDVPNGGIAPVNGGARRPSAMWEIWSKAGRDVLVTGWWATWPADRVRGVLVSDRVALPHMRIPEPSKAGLVFPPERWDAVSKLRVRPEEIDFDTLNAYVPVTREEFAKASEALRRTTGLYRDRIAHLASALAATRTYERASLQMMSAARPDLWAAYYELVDTVSHLFVNERRGQEAIAAAYVEMDRALGEVARALDPDVLVVVLSDHGFYSRDAGIRENPSDLTAGATAWHRPAGVVATITAGVLSGRTPGGNRQPGTLGTISALDVLPTLLACADLPNARDMPGRVLPWCAGATRRPVVASYGAHELPQAASREPGAAIEMERLRALGYIAGAAPPSSLARVNLGEILFRKGDLRGAQAELSAIVRVDPTNTRAVLWLARTFAALGRPDAAVEQYDRLIQAALAGHRDLDPIVFLAATDLDIGQRRPDAAAERLKRVPAALAEAPEVLVARGALAEVRRNVEEAERHYRRALEVAPADTETLERLVDLLLRTGRAPVAAAMAASLAGRYPSSALHQSLAGESALGERRYERAEAFFARAVALEPGAESVRIELARARLLGGRPDAALDALAPLAGSREAEAIRGAAFSRKSDWPAAIGAYERALAGGEATVEMLNGLGYAQMRAGRNDQAAMTFERSLKMKADQPEIRKLLDAARKRPSAVSTPGRRNRSAASSQARGREHHASVSRGAALDFASTLHRSWR